MKNHNVSPVLEVKILDQRIGDSIPLPSYTTDGSAGMDLRACIDSSMVLKPKQCELVSTGIAIYLQQPTLTALIVPRSGLGSKHGIVLGNLVGVIDSDYQGPLMVPLWNRSEQDYTIEPGERIAQMLVVPIYHPTISVVSNFTQTTQRGEGGFGHTGKI